MIAYRYQTHSGQWQWLQTSSRLVYKNSKPDFVISTHRPLMEEEGRDLLGKRTMDFKVSYLDAGLTNSYFADSEQVPVSTGTLTPAPQRVNRRYKTQLRDFLSTCRTKRKIQAPAPAVTASPSATVEYLPTAETVYPNLNPVYTTGYSDLSYMSSSNFQHSPYPVDNRFLGTGDLFHQYAARSYYPDYSASYNGFLPTYETPVLKETHYVSSPKCLDTSYVLADPKHKHSPAPSTGSSPTNGIPTPKVEEQERQTVLMWGDRTSPKPVTNGNGGGGFCADPLKSLAEMGDGAGAGSPGRSPKRFASQGPAEVYPQHQLQYQYYPYTPYHHATQ